MKVLDRESLIDTIVSHQSENMDIDSLVQYFEDMQKDYLSKMSDSDILEYIDDCTTLDKNEDFEEILEVKND